MLRADKGFTLVELMVGLVCSIIVTAVMYSMYKVQNQSSVVQNQVSEMQQNLRAGLDVLTRDLRMAGYDPSGSGKFGVSEAKATKITYTLDDGAGNTETHVIELYTAADGVQKIGEPKTTTTSAKPLAENVENVEFSYFVGNYVASTPVFKLPTVASPLTAGELNDIRAIRISLLVRADKESSDFVNTGQYVSASGVTWYPTKDAKNNDVTDSFRRRMISTTVNLRNVGM